MRNDIYLKEVGKKINAIRKAKGISLRKLEDLTDIDMANISRIENGKINFHILTLNCIAEVLEVNIKDLI